MHQPETFTVTFTAEHLQVLNDALIELPFRRAMPVITAINEQIAAAQEPEGEAAERP